MTYRNFEFPVEPIDELVPREILGYRRGPSSIGLRRPYVDLGLFDFGGTQRRLLAFGPDASYFHSLASGDPVENATCGFPSKDGLQQLIDDGQLTRHEPVATQ